MLNKFIKEPLIHFLFISGVIFFFYDLTNDETKDIYKITISESRIEQLTNEIVNTKKRSPVAKEIGIAIESFVLNEIYLRQARELGLDRNDRVINRRLRQKMEYLLDEMASIQQPSPDELSAFYQKYIERYKTPTTYSFTQVYVSTDRSKSALADHLNAQQFRIEQGEIPQADSSMLPRQVSNKSWQQVEHQFGQLFITQLDKLPIQVWSKPISSGLGQHFVYIDKKIEAKAKPLTSIKQNLTDDWQYEQRKKFKQAYEAELMRRYQINVITPKINEPA